ncbi:MAG: DUF2191 domain-containing protein [Bordetella sp.]|nr:DUF2191 domain-containing protein [Bordetella sp.]
MKTTLNLDDEVVTRTNTGQRTGLTAPIEEGQHTRLQAAARSRATPRLPVYAGEGGLAPGLNGLRNKDVLDAADE